ncbi:ATP-binding protein [Streptomyces specialis]|uniref:ATP-binding protein n=1 Tax=Streptomyces specialis TaxID=498367 RepID=UPI00073E631C|nr:ATP-binding protein [Streptomyces specialis]
MPVFPLHGTTPLTLPAQAPTAPGTPRQGERFALPALAESVATARDRVERRFDHWGLPREVRDTARLVISELVTNALLHTDSHIITCRLEASPRLDRLRIEVADEGRGLDRRAAPRPASADSEHGRGLVLLDALAARWGVLCPDRNAGCTVWAELRP